MRLLLQRVRHASVTVSENTVGSIAHGIVALLGVAKGDTHADADYLLEKMLGLRIFPDSQDKMNLSIRDTGGSLLIISQFTLYADCRRGRRPSFDPAASPADAEKLYNYFVQAARNTTVPVETGIFGAMMDVRLLNEGPVTIILDSADCNK